MTYIRPQWKNKLQIKMHKNLKNCFLPTVERQRQTMTDKGGGQEDEEKREKQKQ